MKKNNFFYTFIRPWRAFVIVFILMFVSAPVVTLSAQQKASETKTSTPAAKDGAVDKKAEAGEATGVPEREYGEDDFKPQLEEESYAWLVIKTIIILGLLVGGFYYFFRFVTKKAGIQMLGGDVVNVLSVVPLGQNKYLQVVDLAGRVLVLGVADNSINLITEITDRDRIDRIRIESQRYTPAGNPAFQDFLTRNIGRVVDRISDIKNRQKSNSSISGYESGMDLSYLKEQKKRLKKMNGLDNE